MKNFGLLFAMMLLPVAAFAQSVTWSLNNDTLTVGGAGAMDDYDNSVNLPPWDAYKNDITAVVIADGVTRVGMYAFTGCANLASVTVGHAVTAIADSAFTNCTALASVVSNAPTPPALGADAFSNIASGAILTTPAGSEADYARSAWYGSFASVGSSVAQVWRCGIAADPASVIATLADGTLTVSGAGAMADYSPLYATPWDGAKAGITAAVISDGVTGVGAYAFAGCSALASVVSNAATPPALGADAFSNIASGAILTTPAGSGNAYARSAWADCFAIPLTWDCGAGDSPASVTATLADGALTISGTGAMADYTPSSPAPWHGDKAGITTVAITGGVTGGGAYAFAGCGALVSVALPASMTTIESGIFRDCIALSAVALPASATAIGQEAFYGSGLRSIDFPASVATIGAAAFAECDSLHSVEISDQLTTIGQRVFYGSGLRSIVIPDQVTAIEPEAFGECGELASVVIGVSATTIGAYAFRDCAVLTEVTIRQPTPPAILPDVFDGLTLGDLKLIVPYRAAARYREAEVWKAFGQIEETPTLTADPATLDFVSDGSALSLAVTANVVWTADASASWLTLSPVTGNGDGEILATAAANGSILPRTATISVVGGGVSRTVAVTQAAAPPMITVAPDALDFTASGGTQSLAVTSNAAWTAVGTEPWLTVSPATGNGNGTLQVKATVNNGDVTRTASVIVRVGSIIERIIPVTQSVFQAAALTVSPASLAFASAGGVQSLAVTGNVAWTAVCSDDWLTATPAAGANSGVILVTARANSASDPLTATILVRGSGIDCLISVTIDNDTGNESVAAAVPHATCFNRLLTVASPVAERIEVYSAAGALLGVYDKPSGAATYPVGHLPQGVLIVRGASGWVQKVLRE